MVVQYALWNICMSSLVILAASVFEISGKTKKNSGKNPTHATAVSVATEQRDEDTSVLQRLCVELVVNSSLRVRMRHGSTLRPDNSDGDDTALYNRLLKTSSPLSTRTKSQTTNLLLTVVLQEYLGQLVLLGCLPPIILSVLYRPECHCCQPTHRP